MTKMMKRLLLLLTVCLETVALCAQSDPVVMTINGKPVPRSEFEYSYNKNNTDGVVDKKSVEEYVDLFINYKLKVQAALDARLDTLTSFRQEFALYRDQQVRPAMVTDADVLAEARRLYDDTKAQIGPKGLIQLAHILIRLSTMADKDVQEKARQRADSVYQALQAGADFAELAKKVSQDEQSAVRGGLLPWMAPNQAFKEFEDAAYALQKGEMSAPVLSPVGYHIILMKDRKQLEPFEELQAMIVKSIEQQGVRDRLAEQMVSQEATRTGETTEFIMDQKADSLSQVDPEMKYLIQEYHDGLLLYEMSTREVWDKAAKDEAGLEAYFKDHRKDYAWTEPRFKGMAYHVKTKADVKAVRKCVKGLPFEAWNEKLRQTFNPDSVIRIRVEKGIFKPGDNALIDREVFKRDAQVTPVEGYPIDAVFGKKLKKGPEDYTDVRNLVVADYQDMLEKAWVYDLRRRYPVTVDQEVLKSINKHQ